jgi:hypothetical protein
MSSADIRELGFARCGEMGVARVVVEVGGFDGQAAATEESHSHGEGT